jgi:hypothetical protein
MNQLLVLSVNRKAVQTFSQERRMRARDQQKWKPVLRPVARSFFEKSA